MPRSKITQKIEEEPISESYISIGLGILVVVVVGVLLYNYFTQKNQTGQETQNEAEKTAQEATTSAKPGTTYTVVEGDTLWGIAEKSYQSGYNWTDIAKANNLTNADALEAGQQLTIPEVTPMEKTVVTTETPAQAASPETAVQASPETAVASPEAQVQPTVTNAITGDSYTVVAGDNLWDISCRAYADCYQWTKIAQSNKLENPDLIHPGNVLTLPR